MGSRAERRVEVERLECDIARVFVVVLRHGDEVVLLSERELFG